MAIYEFPNDGEKKKEKTKKERPAIQPEIIDIDELKENRQEEMSFSTSGLKHVQISTSLRIIAFFGGLSLLVIGSSLFLMVLIIWLLNGLTFGRLQKKLDKWWKYTKYLYGMGLGLLLLSASPPLGFGFLTLYIFLQDKSFKNTIFGRTFDSKFNQ